MHATGANPTLVQNDEHILVKGHQSGFRIGRVFIKGMDHDRKPGYTFWILCCVQVVCLISHTVGFFGDNKKVKY